MLAFSSSVSLLNKRWKAFLWRVLKCKMWCPIELISLCRRKKKDNPAVVFKWSETSKAQRGEVLIILFYIPFTVELLCLYLMCLAEQQVLVEWINSTLKPEHIVIQNLEEDIYDGLVIHHLLGKKVASILSATAIKQMLVCIKHFT